LGKGEILKNILFIFLSICIFTSSIFSETKKTVEKINEYGGETIQINYEDKDKNAEQLEASIYYYNKAGERQKIIHKHNKEFQKASGYIQQEQYYKENQVYAYILILNKDSSENLGYKYRIEYVDKDDNITEYRYCTDQNEFREIVDESFDEFPIMTIKVLNKHIHEDYEKNLSGNTYIYHFDPFTVRSIVRFTSDPMTITIEDNEIIESYLGSIGMNDYISSYKHKVLINENGNMIVGYLQEPLAEYVRKENYALIEYGYMGFNEEIVLFINGFIDAME